VNPLGPLRLYAFLLSLAVTASVVLSDALAAAPAPAGYRAKLDALCRSYTPKLESLDRRMTRAARANEYPVAVDALRRRLMLVLAEDARIAKVPVPDEMRAQVRPLLVLLRTADVHMRRALGKAGAGNDLEFFGEITKLDQVDSKIGKRFDRLGVSECAKHR
jgi:hypothetical protein